MPIDLHTPVCDLLGCDVPIVLAGMGGVARSELVAAVTDAGGFGFLGMVRESPDLIRAEIAKVRAATKRDFGVNLIPAATAPDLFDAELDTCIAERVPVVGLFWDLDRPAIDRLRAAGILVVCQVGTAAEAVQAEQAGAHVIIAQGVEAGGHVRGTTPLLSLVPQIVEAVEIPILAAGGIADGRAVAAALSLGAEGAVIGTAFLATQESFAHDYHKNRIVEAQAGVTLRTDAFHINWPRGAHVRVLPNSVTAGKQGCPFSGSRKAIGKEGDRTIWLFSTDSPLQSMTGDFEAMALYAGEGVGKIASVVPAAQRLKEIVTEAETELAAGVSRGNGASAAMFTVTPTASPVCYASEAPETYLGFASRNEQLVFLNELLEAERAGARIAARTAADATNREMARLMKDIHRDESRWCATLLKWIGRLEGEPSPNVGDFYGKCLAIANLPDRAAFINRGQGWVVRKLRDMLPKLKDDQMHADLTDMLRSHEENIARTNALLP